MEKRDLRTLGVIVLYLSVVWAFGELDNDTFKEIVSAGLGFYVGSLVERRYYGRRKKK